MNSPRAWKESPSVAIRIPRRRVLRAESASQLRGRALLSLVQNVFFPAGSAQRTRVLFAAADDQTHTAHLCESLAVELAAITGSRIGIVSSSLPVRAEKGTERDTKQPDCPALSAEMPQSGCERLSENVWRIPESVFDDGNTSVGPEAGLLREIIAEFAFTLVASGISEARSKARNLACDGVVLVVTAGQTRREVALHARDELKGGEAPLLGTILAGRRFPIPEAIYRRL